MQFKQKLSKMDPGFIKADSANLPKIDLLMMGEFLASNKDFCSAEFCNVKNIPVSKSQYYLIVIQFYLHKILLVIFEVM